VDSQVTFVLPGDSVEMDVLLVHKAPLVEGLKFVMREGI
jgi:translation elongation factor EF-Tu-like GTPase